MDEDPNVTPVGEAEANEHWVGELEDTVMPGAGRGMRCLSSWSVGSRGQPREPLTMMIGMSGDWDRNLLGFWMNALVSSVASTVPLGDYLSGTPRSGNVCRGNYWTPYQETRKGPWQAMAILSSLNVFYHERVPHWKTRSARSLLAVSASQHF